MGDAAGYAGPGPQDDQVVVEALTGRFIFSVSLVADSEIFGQVPAPWVSLAKAVVSQLSESPQPPPMPPAAAPAECRPGVPPGGDSESGAQAAGSITSDVAADPRQAQPYLQELYAHRSDGAYLVGFFDHLDTNILVNWLNFRVDGQILEPDGYDAPSQHIVDGQTGDWFLREFEAAAATCQLSRDAAYNFLSRLNDFLPRLQTLAEDPAAARGLLVPLSAQDIMLAVQSPFEEPPFTALAGAALSAGSEISVLVPPPWKPDPSVHFTLAQAIALEFKAQFTSDGDGMLETAVTRFAQHIEPPPPGPQAFGALTAADQYTAWAFEIGDLEWAVSVQYAAETAAGWTHPTVDDWQAADGDISSVPGSGAHTAENLQLQEESNIDGATDYALLITDLIVKWLRQLPHATQVQQQDQAQAAQWLCGRENRVEDMLFLSMLYSQRLLLNRDTSNPSITVPLSNGTMIDGFHAFFAPSSGFPPIPVAGTTFDRNIAGALRPPVGKNFATSLADSAHQNTGLAARVPFDNLVWQWQQRISDDGLDACTALPDVPIYTPPSGISSGITVTGSGYAPNSGVTITGHSKPVVLGTAFTNGAGAFVALVDPGAELPPGRHEIVASGRTPTGTNRTLRWPIRVVRSSTGQVRIGPSPGSGHGHGSAWIPLAAGAAGLCVGLIGVFLAIRIRRRGHQPGAPVLEPPDTG